MSETNTELAPKLLHILQHSLGVDEYGRGKQYRNHFVTGPGSKDWDSCQALVQQGLMTDRGPQTLADGMHCFTVTDEGRKAVAQFSPKPPKVSPGRQRYLDYLEVADIGWTFIEWLKWRSAERRKGAIV